MRAIESGLLAVLSGLAAIVAASVSLATREQMTGPFFMMRPDPTPAYLLMSFGILLLVNGTLLAFGVHIPMRAQGSGMIVYGVLMLIVGTLMAVTTVFAMQMGMLSALAMYLFGALMVVSGFLMVTQQPMAMASEPT
jgi:hypothetical protein